MAGISLSRWAPSLRQVTENFLPEGPVTIGITSGAWKPRSPRVRPRVCPSCWFRETPGKMDHKWFIDDIAIIYILIHGIHRCFIYYNSMIYIYIYHKVGMFHSYFSLPGGIWVENCYVYLMLAAGKAPCPCRWCFLSTVRSLMERFSANTSSLNYWSSLYIVSSELSSVIL